MCSKSNKKQGELGVSLLTVLCIKCVETRYGPKYIQHSVLLGIECVHFLGEQFFVHKVQFCGSGSVRVTVLCSEVWGEREKQQEKLTFVILKEVE